MSVIADLFKYDPIVSLFFCVFFLGVLAVPFGLWYARIHPEKEYLLQGLLCLGVALVGFAASIEFYHGAREAAVSKDWPSTQGVISRSWIEHCRISRYSAGWCVHARYDYSVNGASYHSNRIMPGSPYFAAEEGARARIYPAGIKVAVYYNPVDPAAAFLLPGRTSGINQAFYIFVIVSAGFLCAGAIRMRQDSPAKR